MIFSKLTKAMSDIESLLRRFSSNTLWRWYAILKEISGRSGPQIQKEAKLAHGIQKVH